MKKFLIIIAFISCFSVFGNTEAVAQNDSTFIFKNAFISGNKTLIVSFETAENTYVGIGIYDVLGNQMALKFIEIYPGPTVERIDVSNLKPGLYFISLCEGEETFVTAFVVAEK